MRVPEQVFADVLVLSPCGRIDLSNGEAFQACLAETVARRSSPPPLVVLDLAELDYISSIGLRALLVAAKQARAAGGTLAVARLTPTVAEIFEISRFHFVVPVFAGTREALASLSAEAAAAWDRAAEA